MDLLAIRQNEGHGFSGIGPLPQKTFHAAENEEAPVRGVGNGVIAIQRMVMLPCQLPEGLHVLWKEVTRDPHGDQAVGIRLEVIFEKGSPKAGIS